jgi:Glycosyl transferase family 2
VTAPRVLALVVAFNEADVIDATLRGLVEQGCEAWVIDHGSTDGTGDIARSWLGRGVVHVERFPEDSGFHRRNAKKMVWADLLRRRQQIVEQVDADWYVLNDADEFRESPWPGLTFAEGLARAESMGYNAVNFRVLNFRPTGEGFQAGDDPRERLTQFEPGDPCDTAQVKAFKRPDGPIELLNSGGHDVAFEGRRVCPVPFILRHYPIRSGEHGKRKILGERLPRFAEEERANGWHVQYDELIADGATFVWDAADLQAWHPDRIRAELLAGALDTLLTASRTGGREVLDVHLEDADVHPWLQDTLGREVLRPELRRGGYALERLLQGADPAEVALSDVDAVPLAARMLDAVDAQMEVAGQIIGSASVRRIKGEFLAAAAAHAAEAARFPGARGFVAYADLDEAVASPGLIAAFASAFDADSDATLVLAGDGWSEDRVASELGPVIDALGIDGPACPDLLAVTTVPGDLAARVHAVLSEAGPRPGLDTVPHVAADGPELLLELAGRHWDAVAA